jgi:uncharacterized protein (DUF58 family)
MLQLQELCARSAESVERQKLDLVVFPLVGNRTPVLGYPVSSTGFLAFVSYSRGDLRPHILDYFLRSALHQAFWHQFQQARRLRQVEGPVNPRAVFVGSECQRRLHGGGRSNSLAKYRCQHGGRGRAFGDCQRSVQRAGDERKGRTELPCGGVGLGTDNLDIFQAVHQKRGIAQLLENAFDRQRKILVAFEMHGVVSRIRIEQARAWLFYPGKFMLTSRGWWLLLTALFLAALGAALPVARGGTAAILGLTVLVWVVFEWCRFLFALRWGVPELHIERELRDDRGPVVTLWSGRTFTVIVRISTTSRLSLPFALIDDRLPFGVKLVDGGTNGAGQVSRGKPVEISYRIRCRSSGPVRFEGVRLRFADPQGFFFHEAFLRRAVEYPALPPLVDAEANQRHTKHDNMLPPPGIHRLRRAGSGSELLDLRDYQPGDPPRMIAWKASARKDKLIVKELENDVPVRCTMLVDASQAVRLGPPGNNALARLIEIASSVAQAALGNRDHVGLITFDEESSAYMPPSRSKRHLVDLLRRLSEIGRLPVAASRPDAESLIPLAHALAQEVYPDLLDSRLNTWRWWLPILFPRPEYLRSLTLGDAVFPWWRRLSLTEWRQQAVRKRLAAVLTVVNGLPPGALALMHEDDLHLSIALQEFLSMHQVPYPVPMYDWRGKYLFASPEKVEVLAAALLTAVRRGRDNELFVLAADLFELTGRMEPLRRAVRVALGRHHRVVLICPWSPDIPLPDSEELEPASPMGDVMAEARRSLILRYHRAFQETRREFGRLAVPVVCAKHREPVQLILDRMEQLRVAGIRR